METASFSSPLGPIALSVNGGRLGGVLLLGPDEPVVPGGKPSAAMRQYLRALEAYFAGSERALRDDRLDFGPCTPFAAHVYRALRGVRFGEVVTYGELARLLERPKAARAVGQAMARNPLPVFVPCHRVVAVGGRLGGFGAGLEWKAGLLRHEGWTVTEGRIS